MNSKGPGLMDRELASRNPVTVSPSDESSVCFVRLPAAAETYNEQTFAQSSPSIALITDIKMSASDVDVASHQ